MNWICLIIVLRNKCFKGVRSDTKCENSKSSTKQRPVAEGNLIALLAAQTASSFNVFDMKVKKIEQEVEAELQYEHRELHGCLDRLRFRVETVTHSKVALFTTVALNLCDAVLVVLELVFDFLFFSGGKEYMEAKHGVTKHATTVATKDTHDDHGSHPQYEQYGHYSHYVHYASICVLSVLLLLVLAHVFGSGKHFFKTKINILDFIVVVVAWILDVVTYKGIYHYGGATAIALLIVLLLLRVIRVLNSLVVIVMDGQRFQIRIMYTQNKKLVRELEMSKSRRISLENKLKIIKVYCIAKGLDEDAFDRIVTDDTVNNNDMETPKSRGNIVTRRLKKISTALRPTSRPQSKYFSPTNDLGVNNRGFDEEAFTFTTGVPFVIDDSGILEQPQLHSSPRDDRH